MTAGRPSEYETTKVASGVQEYIRQCHAQQFLPTIEGLAVHFGVGRATIYRWGEAHEEFRDILDAFMAAQGSQLIQNSLVGNYNSTITKLLLTKHGYHDKQDITSDGKRMGQPLLYALDNDSDEEDISPQKAD